MPVCQLNGEWSVQANRQLAIGNWQSTIPAIRCARE